MNTSSIPSAENPQVAKTPFPVPLKPVVAQRTVHTMSTGKGREHEVQRLILDLAELAASRDRRTA
ncbi:hypothetical protein NCCP2145_23750 [Pseudarthrobacter sp. NCCP-2145]|nr:hypothetical protein NCCP2145_23750 [Pseudarthrobacter sp. NCCP-2145]